MRVETEASGGATAPASVRTVPVSRPLAWVRAGWNDLDHLGVTSIAHGLLVTGLGVVVLLLTAAHPYSLAAAISGFLLVGPVFATGLCELSRRRALGESPDFEASLEGVTRHTDALIRFAGLLFALTVAWFLVSGLILAVILPGELPTIAETVWGGFLLNASPLQVAAYVGAGGVLAVIALVLSVVSVPAIIDRDISAVGAMRLSAAVVAANPLAILLWAGLIVALIALGFATFMLGMILLYPLVGHATWHAYRDLVG